MPRHEKPIDWDLVDKLLEAGCLGTEIAANFNMHPETFYDRVQKEYNVGFTEYQSQKRCKGDSLLRAVQYQLAVNKKDKSMLIWLGKQRLGQKENNNSTENIMQTFSELKKAVADGSLLNLLTQARELNEEKQ